MVDQENFILVVDVITFRIMMVMMLKNNWKAEIIDIENIFLYKHFDEQIYMKIP